jgi:hypothetical protein
VSACSLLGTDRQAGASMTENMGRFKFKAVKPEHDFSKRFAL